VSVAGRLLYLIESSYPSELTYVAPNYFLRVGRRNYLLSSDDKDALQKLRRLGVESKWGDADQTLSAVKERGSVRISVGRSGELKRMKLEEV